MDLEAAVRQRSPKVVNAAPVNAAPVNATVPAPGQGRTPLRHRILLELGRDDLDMARLGAAHLDALAILSEGGREPLQGVLYGVWAGSDELAPDAPVSEGLIAERAEGYWRISGRKLHCCGAAIVSAALVTAQSPDGVLLFEVPMRTRGIRIERPDTGSSTAGEPMAVGLADAVVFDGVMVSEAGVIGGPNWYRNRPGYWNGAIGVAACWAGGAQSLVDAARNVPHKDAGARAQLVALEAVSWNLARILDLAGREIDADPGDAAAGRRRALRVRHLIRCHCTEVLERFGYATSPDVLAFNEDVARQHTALSRCMRDNGCDYGGDAGFMAGALSALS